MDDGLIITNGDVAAGRIREAGIEGEILAWADVLHEGPVTAGLDLEELSALRARFIAREMGFEATEVASRFAVRDAVIRRHAEFRQVELWFEHDLYDQLQLIQLLDFLVWDGRKSGICLVQSGDHLGRMEIDRLSDLSNSKMPAGPSTIDLARGAWRAFTASSPEDLAQCARTAPTEELPYLRPALDRLVHELPAPGSGLSLTEERILDGLVEEPMAVGTLFGHVARREAAEFLGDASFFRRLDGLAFAKVALLDGLPFESHRCVDGPGHADYRDFAQSEVSLTDAGRAALAGELDHAVENHIDRWLGGTHLREGNLWRWDRHGGVLIKPS